MRRDHNGNTAHRQSIRRKRGEARQGQAEKAEGGAPALAGCKEVWDKGVGWQPATHCQGHHTQQTWEAAAGCTRRGPFSVGSSPLIQPLQLPKPKNCGGCSETVPGGCVSPCLSPPLFLSPHLIPVPVAGSTPVSQLQTLRLSHLTNPDSDSIAMPLIS